METALLIPCPEADAIVDEHRQRLDLAAQDGIPAHITVLYPFKGSELLTPEDSATIAAIAAATDPFTYSLSTVGWFGDNVTFLHPDPSAPFEALTTRATADFPGLLPYGGAFDSVVPHLTIGDFGSPDELRHAAEAVGEHLPLQMHANELWLMEGAIGQPWVLRDKWPLGY